MLALLISALLATPPAPERYEVMGFPATSFNTDTGFHFGLLGLVARFESDYSPYRYRIEAKTEASVRQAADGEAEFPSHDHFLVVDLPELLPGFRLFVDARFLRDIRLYHGLGNASVGPDILTVAKHRQYTRAHPELSLIGRVTVSERVFVSAGFLGLYSSTTVHDASALATELHGAADDHAARTLRGTHDHFLFSGQLGVEYDSRDHEINTRSGAHMYVTAEAGAAAEGDMVFGRVDLGTRAYFPLPVDQIMLAMRLDGTLFVGEPPFYMRPVLGGEKVLRGIPEGRYTGVHRVNASVELRAMFLTFFLAGQRLELGAVAFLDAGRVFSGFGDHTDLDGEGAGIHWGAGGGLRLLWGESILVRLDLGASPRTIGGYLGIGPTF